MNERTGLSRSNDCSLFDLYTKTLSVAESTFEALIKVEK